MCEYLCKRVYLYAFRYVFYCELASRPTTKHSGQHRYKYPDIPSLDACISSMQFNNRAHTWTDILFLFIFIPLRWNIRPSVAHTIAWKWTYITRNILILIFVLAKIRIIHCVIDGKWECGLCAVSVSHIQIGSQLNKQNCNSTPPECILDCQRGYH